jgi:hypothetical protein
MIFRVKRLDVSWNVIPKYLDSHIPIARIPRSIFICGKKNHASVRKIQEDDFTGIGGA